MSVLLAPPVLGQEILLQGGTLHLSAGTSVSVQGAIGFVIAPGAAVINDGTIDLGAACMLTEQPGSPITGTGTEHALWPDASPLADAEPGGLGLTLSTAYDGGNLEVTRGHLPITLPNSAQSIARWFFIDMPDGSVSADAVIAYDISELNGIDPSALSIFESPSYNGPWTALASVSSPGTQEISATDQAPVAYLTGFDAAAANPVLDGEGDGWRVWPTVVERVVHVRIPDNRSLRSLELMDSQGKVLWKDMTPVSRTTRIDVDLPDLAQGLYLLRMNGESTTRLIRR